MDMYCVFVLLCYSGVQLLDPVRTQLIASQPHELQGTLHSFFAQLLDGISLILSTRYKDRFQDQLQSFRSNVLRLCVAKRLKPQDCVIMCECVCACVIVIVH